MGLLDGGGAAIFGGIFGGLYLDATLHRPTITHSTAGGGTEDPDTAGTAVKVQLEAATEAMRQSDGFTALDVRILMLAQGVDRPTTEHEVQLNGTRYAIVGPVGRDPCGAYWDIQGRPTNAG